MKSTQFLKAFFLLLAITIIVIVGYFFTASPISITKFSTTYQDYPDPSSMPHIEPKQVVEVPGMIYAFDIAQNADKIAIATSKEVIVYNLTTQERLFSYPLTDEVTSVHFSPDASKLAVSGNIPTYYQSGHMHILVLDTSSWKTLYEYESEPEVYSPEGVLAWSPDNEKIAFSIPDHGLSVIDILTGKDVARLNDFINPPFDVSWSPDGKRIIATGDYGNGIRRWRLDTDQSVRLWNSNLQPASQIQWSPDGKKIASGHYGGDICIWNVRNNSCEGMIYAHFNWVGALDWSPDSQQVASASGAIRIWDASTGEMKSGFGFYDGIVYKQLQWFNPQTIATLETSYTEYFPSTIRFWDTSTGNVKLAFRGWDNVYGSSTGGVMLVLDDVQIGLDHSIIEVSLRYDTPDLSTAGPWNLNMTDSQGRVYPLTDITPLDIDRSVKRIYETVPLQAGERITLDIASFPPQQGIPMLIDVSANPGIFTFDPSALQVGESLAVPTDIDVNGWLLHLNRVEMPASNELLFEFISEGVYNGVMIFSPTASESSTNLPENGIVTASLKFLEMPDTPIEIEVTKLFYKNLGPLELNFNITKSMFADLPPAQEVEPNPASAPEPKYTSQDPLFIEVQSLVTKFDQAIIQKGWVHVISEVTSENLQPGQKYPPPYYKEEQWYEVDNEGWVLRNLTTHFDGEGNVIQQSVLVGKNSLNLTIGETMEIPAYQLSLDQTLVALDYALNNSHTVQREDTTCDDSSPCLLIKMRDGKFARHVWVNTNTGQLVKLLALEYGADEAEITQFTQTFLPAEWTSAPPQEVLDLFEKVIFPTP